jgi:KDO2-lipid IV(A) lauroyltransferase
MKPKGFFARGGPTRFAFQLGKYSPPRGGRLLAGLAARILVTLKPTIYDNVYDNQRHVLGPEVSDAELRRQVYRVFLNAGRAYYELFHNVGRGRLRVNEFTPPVRLLPEAATYIQEALDYGRGVFLIGCHTANFDLSGMALSQFLSVPMQVLSLADPPAGYDLFNDLRKQGGAMVTPITPATLLQSGGIVITGVDRPTGQGDQPVEFFGATAHLPTGYIRIPLRTDCLVIIMASFYEDGAYHLTANPSLEMVRTGDRAQDVIVNLQRVLAQVEEFIRRYPDQWMMFERVWK